MRFVLALLLFALASFSPLRAYAEQSSLEGEWHQITSNAGKCADCRISIEENETDFTVTANNGWSAVVRTSLDEKKAALGHGSWKPDFGGPYGGMPFLLRLGVVDGRLLMVMTVTKANGSVTHIKAVFERTMLPGLAL